MWQKRMMTVVAIGLFIWGFQVWSSEYLPKGCSAVPVEGAVIQVQTDAQHLLFFHNVSDKQIWLANREHVKLTVGIEPATWNVFYQPNTKLVWRCIQSEQGHEQQVACQDVMAMCHWSVQAPENMQKTKGLWLVENQSIVYAKAYLQRMGWLFDQHRTK